MKSIGEIINKSLGTVINEITTTSNVGGTYKPPLRPGLRKWFKKDLSPYTEITSPYRDAELNYDMLDGETKKTKKEIKKRERIANYVAHKDYRQDAPVEGDYEYAPAGFKYLSDTQDINESTSDSSSGRGSYVAPIMPGFRKFKKSQLSPFETSVSKYDSSDLAYDSYDGTMETPKSKIKKLEKQAKKISKYVSDHFVGNDDDGDILNNNPGFKNKNSEISKPFMNEDLGVWFGTKKKPKGSKQPKGPWVNICRKKEGGGHPPCGRPEADSKGYPKCRAAGVAAKMTDSQKKSACAQKRRAEKTNPKIGTGNKPKMVSYKPRQDEQLIKSLIKKFLK